MIRHLTLAAAALVVAMPFAAAQPQPSGGAPAENAGPSPAGGERARGGDGMQGREGRERGPRWERGREGPRGPHGRGGRGGRGGPDLAAPSVAINMGPGRSLHLQCGDTDIVACLEAAQPLIDQLGEMPAGPRGRRGPPPPPRAGEGELPAPPEGLAPDEDPAAL